MADAVDEKDPLGPKETAPDNDLPPPPAYDANGYAAPNQERSAAAPASDPRSMRPEERVAYGRAYMADFLAAPQPQALRQETRERSVSNPGPVPALMSKWEAKLAHKEEKMHFKLQRKTERCARKEARHQARYAERY
jgi:hypothetical protein